MGGRPVSGDLFIAACIVMMFLGFVVGYTVALVLHDHDQKNREDQE